MQVSDATTCDIDPFVAPLRDTEFLVGLIAEISGSTVADVTRRLVLEHEQVGSNVRQAMRERGLEPFVWSSDLEQFYVATDAFLYETLVWNRSNVKNEMRRWIGEHLCGLTAAPQRVLTFGDGLGWDAYYLAAAGHSVTYFDVSSQCSEFARRIFQRGGVEVDMLNDAADVEHGTYDAVICLDVLEHVPDPVSLVGWLSQLLRPGGRLVVHAPFFLLHSDVHTHLRSNRHFSGDTRRLYQPFGLRPVDGRLFWNPIVLEKQDDPTDKARRGVPWRVTIGGLLLGTGRFWALPHILIARMLTRSNPAQLAAARSMWIKNK